MHQQMKEIPGFIKNLKNFIGQSRNSFRDTFTLFTLATLVYNNNRIFKKRKILEVRLIVIERLIDANDAIEAATSVGSYVFLLVFANIPDPEWLFRSLSNNLDWTM